MKKKFSLIAYLLIMAMFIIPMSGCDDDDDESGGRKSNSAFDTARTKLLVISSDAFEDNTEYNIYTGNSNLIGTEKANPMYYVAPSKSENPVVLQLEFDSQISDDTPFVITKAALPDVVFAYNPAGSGTDSSDNVTTLGSHKTSYSGLELSSALTTSSVVASTIDINTDDEIVIELSGTSATLSGAVEGNLSAQDYVWHVSPDHDGEYWTYGGNEYNENYVLSHVTSLDGVYIARDVRYVPSYLPFSSENTATKSNGSSEGDNDKFYVAYYDESIVGSADTYILAALPSEMGVAMGGGEGGPGGSGSAPNGEPPSGAPGSSMAPAAVTDFDSIIAAMTHSESEAYNNPVLHITTPGTYRLKGTWHGQIWVDIPDSKSISEDKVALILDNVTVSCDVAPALVFKTVYECAGDISMESSADVAADDAWKDVASKIYDEEKNINAGAIVVIAKDSTNTFRGTNVARLNRTKIDTDDYSESDVGKYVKAQKKMYKLDAAFHSRMTMMIGLQEGATSGTLNINSDYEGLDSEMHMLVDSGTVSVTADDDGINVNEDEVSIFAMTGGNLTIQSSGGDGIDSNGYVTITGGNLTIAAGSSKQNSAGEAGIDAEKGVYIYDDSAYTWSKAGSTVNGGSDAESGGGEDSGSTITPERLPVVNDAGEEVALITFNADKILEATYTPEQRIAAGVAESGDVFKVYGTVNNFSGIK